MRIRRPWLIQRCKVKEELQYEHMGSTEYQCGSQTASLKRLFAKGVQCGTAEIELEGNKVTVYIVAAPDLVISDYTLILQKLLEDEYHLQERAYFDLAVKKSLGLKVPSWYDSHTTNCWFEFQNDVLWTLTEKLQQRLLEVLRQIQVAWEKNN